MKLNKLFIKLLPIYTLSGHGATLAFIWSHVMNVHAIFTPPLALFWSPPSLEGNTWLFGF